MAAFEIETIAAITPSVADSIAALEYDLYYIKHLSPGLDLYVLLLACRKWLTSSR